VSGCLGIVAAICHPWWWQRRQRTEYDISDDALRGAMERVAVIPILNTLILGLNSAFME
jgi:hypothetical protein